MMCYLVSLIFPLPEGSTCPRAHINPRLLARHKEEGYHGENPEVPSYGPAVALTQSREKADRIAGLINRFVAERPEIHSESGFDELEDLLRGVIGKDSETEIYPQMSAEDYRGWRAYAEAR